MTGFDSTGIAARLLGEMLAVLDPGHVCRAVDLPLDRAAAAFEVPDPAAVSTGVTPAGFLKVTGAYLRHLRAEGCRPAMLMPVDSAEGEVVGMLQEAYQGMSGTGYHAAMLDACDGDMNGLGAALGTILEETRRRQRQKHTRRVLYDVLGSMPWEVRRDLAGAFFWHARDVLPQDLMAEDCARFVNELPLLVLDYVGARAECLRLLHRGVA